MCFIPKEVNQVITAQHRVLVPELEMKAPRKRRVEGSKRIRWRKLKENEEREAFRRSVVEIRSNSSVVTTKNVKELWEETSELVRF